MSTLKDKFENYEVQPDEKVWTSIENTLHGKAVSRRRRIVAGTATAVVAVAALVIALNAGTRQPEQPVTASAQHEIALAGTAANTGTTAVAADVAAQTVEATPQAKPAAVAPQATAVVSEEASTLPAAALSAPQSETVLPQPQVAVVPEPAVATTTQAVADNSVRSSEPVVEPQPQTTAASEPQRKMTQPERKAANDELVVWIPNAFAPDDPNDEVRLFKVKPNSEANLLSYEIFIYSRAGRQVYHSKDVNAAWDGTANGHQQPMGTYVYIIEINDAVKGIQHKKGTITLIR